MGSHVRKRWNCKQEVDANVEKNIKLFDYTWQLNSRNDKKKNINERILNPDLNINYN